MIQPFSRVSANRTFQLVLIAATSGAAFAGVSTQVRDRFGEPPTMAFPGTNGVPVAASDGSNFENRTSFTFDIEADDGAGFVPFLSYCTEIDSGIGFDTNPPDAVGHTFDVVDLLSDPRFNAMEIDQIERLWFNAFADSLTSAEKATAFQVILWEFSIDNSLNLSSGNFRLDTSDDFTDDVNTQASAWITSLGDGSWQQGVQLQLLSSLQSQDLLRVPEPVSLGLLALGGLLAARRRR